MQPIYLPTTAMSTHIGVCTKFLTQNKGILFKENKHYFLPPGKKYCLWKISAMVAWVERPRGNNKVADEVLEKMFGK